MVKDTELRRGNSVHWCPPNGKKIIMQIKETREDGIICNSHDNKDQRLLLHYDSGDLQPIPLTPEILQRCGFVKTYESGIHTNWEADNLDHPEIGFTFWHEKREMKLRYYGENNINCTYLHQLQNLFFALTGQELEIKMPQTSH